MKISKIVLMVIYFIKPGLVVVHQYPELFAWLSEGKYRTYINNSFQER